jgi:2-oxoglutarate ferredoxin oxidoreductase subunit alpha
MQLTGDRFTSETASFGNDLSTLPNFPAEIRAPAGTLPGVSSFQLHFADHDILTPGDAPNVLVAMNPAALKANLPGVPRGAEIIVNTDEFTKRALAKAGYQVSPLEDGSLDGYSVHPVPLGTLTVEALKEFGLSRKDADRSKNMFVLGLLSWMYHRPTEGTEAFLRSKFAKKPEIARANIAAFRAGWNFGEATEDFAVSYEVAPAAKAFPPGTYRSISGNLALSYGLVAAGRRAGPPGRSRHRQDLHPGAPRCHHGSPRAVHRLQQGHRHRRGHPLPGHRAVQDRPCPGLRCHRPPLPGPPGQSPPARLENRPGPRHHQTCPHRRP